MEETARSLSRQVVVSSQFSKEEEYWTTKFSDEWVKSVFPYTRERTQNSRRMETETFILTGDLCSKLMKLSNNSDYRLHMILTACLVVLLNKYTGNKTIILGTPAFKQDFEAEFINTVLPLRNQVEKDDITFKELLLQVRQTIVEANENQNYPIEQLHYQLGINVSQEDDFPFFDTAVVLENIQDREYLRHIHINTVLSFLRTDDTVKGALEYNSILYDKPTAERIVSHYTRLLQEVLFHINREITGIDMLSRQEKEQLLIDFNHTEAEYPKEKTIHEIFEEQVAKMPDNNAVVDKDGRSIITYKTLNERSNRLAHLLRSKGVKQDIIAAVMLEPSIDLIIGLLGILKAGGAYLPIDIYYPKKRIRFMLNDSAAEILIKKRELKDLNKYDTQNPGNVSKPGNLVYVIYTSGSTGKPKGVLVKHRGLVNLIHSRQKIFAENLHSRLSQVAGPGFDAMASEIWPCLLHGASLYIADDETRMDSFKMKKWLVRCKITISYQPTIMASLLLKENEPGEMASLNALLAAGDTLTQYPSPKHPFQLYNLYGPTEDTVWTTWAKVEPGSIKEGLPHIGKPIHNHRIYIVGLNFKLQPIGVPGEICIGGDGVARGYLNRPELTHAMFVKNPFEPMGKVYRTGDLARWLPEGNIAYLGRMDHQVKIRGFRIELEEIERQLLNIDPIKEAIVNVYEKEKEKYLCAYFLPGKEMEISKIRDILSSYLPYYMIPTYFIPLDKIPLTANGKINRKALPEPEMEADETYKAPRTETEKKLADLWSEELHIDKNIIGIDANLFDLGGHSLTATKLVSKIHKNFNMEIPLVELFKAPTIRGLSEYMKGLTENTFASIEPVEKKDYYALSSAQKRLYFLQHFDKKSLAYNVPQMIELMEETSKEELENTFRKLINRHESLKTAFEMIEGKTVQKVYDNPAFEIEGYDLNAGGSEQKIINDFIRPFDLSKAPLLRVGILKTHDGRRIMMVDMHHIITDGISHGVLINDFLALYSGRELPPLRLQYKDYSQWQQNEMLKNVLKKQEAYWTREFAGEIPVLNLPTDFPRPTVQSFEGKEVGFEISSDQTKMLNELAGSQGATLFMVLLAAFHIFLAKLSSQEDIVVGAPIAGRRHADLEQIIGIFVNTLVIRSCPLGDKTFLQFLHDVKEKTLNAFENQEYQFEELVENVAVERDMSRNPLFDIMFIFQNIYNPRGDINETAPGDLEIKSYAHEHSTAKFDLTLSAVEVGEKVYGSIGYCTRLFRDQTILQFIDYFKMVIASVTGTPEKKIAEIEVISGEEKKQLLYDFNDTTTDYPADKTIRQLFEEQAARTPDRAAVIGIPDHLTNRTYRTYMTYKKLNEQSHSLAHHLRAKGVAPDNIVAIAVERSLEMIVGILGILKAGGAYLPIDPNYPEERINYMLADSNTKILLSEASKVREVSGDIEVIDLTQTTHPNSPTHPTHLTHLTHPTHLSYVIYTSGSTGTPKGVMIEHHSVINRLNWMQEMYPIGRGDVILQKTPVVFDVSVWELFWWSFTGAGLCLLGPGDEKDPRAIVEAVGNFRVTTMHFVPSMLNAFLSYIESAGAGEKETALINLKSLRQVFSSGEALGAAQASRFYRLFKPLDSLKLINLYGPTEATVDVTYYNCSPGDKQDNIPIGKPIHNTRLYVLSDSLHLQPIGVTGQLTISGVQLARGYLNNPDMTAEKFTGFNRSYRSYRTGDLARWLPDGNIEFLGRMDDQVKIRGYRIEPGEIENRLLKYQGIREALVVSGENNTGENYLCAYIVAGSTEHGAGTNMTELRESLAKELPDYMIPAFFIPLEKIPLTPNGKVNRAALPLPKTAAMAGEYTPPQDETEEKLALIWSEVLGIEKQEIGREHNFFQLGGNSLNLITMVSKIYQVFETELPITHIFDKPTIDRISKTLKREKYIELPLVLLNQAAERKLFCFPPGSAYGVSHRGLASAIDDYSFYSFSFIEEEDRLKQYVDTITGLQPVGPYILYGWSSAGGLVFEVAKALEDQGNEVSDILLVDCFWFENKNEFPKEEFKEAQREFIKNVENSLELWGLNFLKEKVRQKVKKYMAYLQHLERTGLQLINANVHLIISEESRAKGIVPNWDKFTRKSLITYDGFGDHENMFEPGPLGKNASLIRGILKDISNKK